MLFGLEIDVKHTDNILLFLLTNTLNLQFNKMYKRHNIFEAEPKGRE